MPIDGRSKTPAAIVTRTLGMRVRMLLGAWMFSIPPPHDARRGLEFLPSGH
jgi:hypothetical protein